MRLRPRRWPLVVICLAVAAAVPLWAVVLPDSSSPVTEKATRHPDLSFRNAYQRLRELPEQAAAEARERLTELAITEGAARLDRRGGRWGTLILSRPLVPGDGVANSLRWDQLAAGAPRGRAAFEGAVWGAFRDYLAAHAQALDIDLDELSPQSRAVAHLGGELLQIHAPRVVGGVPVRGSFLSAAVSHGNLVLLGAHKWGDVEISNQPAVSLEEARLAAREYLFPLEVSGAWSKAQLILLPTARGHDLDRMPVGEGYEHRLAWAIRPQLEGETGRWELLLDAHSGEVLAFEDTLQYATTREVVGGVYPQSNDGNPPYGSEEAGWPMPFDQVLNAGSTLTTDSGGNLLLCADGDITSNLDGEFVQVQDYCGAIGLTSAGDVDFGTSTGTDCTTPGSGGAGNTHASRTSFYELNRAKEQGRGQLPANTWLQSQLTSNVNLSPLCAASWDGTAVSFHCSVPATCANTGELAAVIDHEWGHGLDDNDANPSVSSPGEGIADLYAYLRLDTSCIGRGYHLGVDCTGYGDPCTACDGVRDIDFANRASGLPHDVVWIDANCGTGAAPCGGGVHCEGAVSAEAVYDLIERDLPGLFGMDHNTALEVGTRLTYLGAGAVGTWFQCVTAAPFYGGCNADGGYLNYLVADDDNGDLNDGTPHMSAIFDAFDRHGIACDIPAVVDSGCAGAPALAPVVVATPLDRAVELSWGAVAGATRYQVFRTDGDAACGFGKIKVGETTGLSFTDTGLQNGRDYSWVVIPVSAADPCMGPASACTAATPAAGANLAIDASETLSILSVADGDPFLDNCELARLSFEVSNTGTGSLTNVRIVTVTSPSHPGTTFVTGFPAATTPSTLAECEVAGASFDFIAGGLAFDDTLEIEVEVTADELAASRTVSFFVERTESDFASFASSTFTFDSDLDGWQVVEGTFDRTNAGGGALLTPYYLASSTGLPSQCDHARSRVLRLSATSTLEVYTEYDIEDLGLPCLFCGWTWFDRANVGIYQVATGVRTAVDPDGGRLYNASGQYGSCGTAGQAGWAGTEIAWGSSTWSSTALGAAGFAGQTVQLDVRYGTDALIQGEGFHFDQVTVTDLDLQGADTQSDVCAVECSLDSECDDTLFCNGAETCLAGVCIVGTPPCDDGVSCTVDTCDEGADSCSSAGSDALCDNGLFCDGVETCDQVLDCQAGTAVDCDDAVACTADSCNEGTDACDNVADDAPCDNGLFCDGTEICDLLLGCQAGTAACDDGIGCTVDSCDEPTDTCGHTPDAALCANGLFCDGVEICSATLDCQPGLDPCSPLGCDEPTDVCTGTPVGQLEAGTVTVPPGGGTSRVNLAQAYVSPVIVATARYKNSIRPEVPRISNVTATSFDVRLQNPRNLVVASETISYLVVEEGSWTIDAVAVDAQKYLSPVTDAAPASWVGEAQTYGQSFTEPVVVGQVMSENDPDWSVFWARGPTLSDPPSPAALTTGKTVCEDSDVTRADETVGFVVFEAGHGTLGGVEFEAAVGSDKINGVDDTPVPDFYNFQTPFSSVPQIAVLSMAGLDDSDGGWAQGHGGLVASAVNLFLSIDEDEIGDAERSHANEQVSYVAFAQPVVYSTAPLGSCGHPDNLTLLDEDVTSTVTYQACTSIMASDGFQVLTPGDVTLRAGSSVALGDGFVVGGGATFEIEIDPALAP